MNKKPTWYLVLDKFTNIQSALKLNNKLIAKNFNPFIYKAKDTPRDFNYHYYVVLKKYTSEQYNNLLPNETSTLATKVYKDLKIEKRKKIGKHKISKYSMINVANIYNFQISKLIKNYQMEPIKLDPIDQKTIKAIKNDVGKDNLQNFLMTSVDDIVHAIVYWTTRLQNASTNGQLTIQNEISSLEGILLKKSKITQYVYQTALDDILQTNLESIEPMRKTTNAQNRENKEIDIANKLRNSNKSPDVKTINDKLAKSNITPFTFKEAPTLRELSTKCKELIVDNNSENAKKLAEKHLLEANYIPKKEKQKARKWGESEFNKWFTTIVTNAKATPSEKKEETTSPAEDKEENFDPMEIEGFNKTADTLTMEIQAFNNLADRIYKLEELNEKNKDKESATEQHNYGLRKKNLYDIFFKNRSYSKEEIEKLKTYFSSSNANTDFDPFFILKGELKNDNITVNDIRTNIEKDKREGCDYSSTLDFYLGQITDTIVKDEDNVEHELYTPLHVKELIKTLYDEITAKALTDLADSTQPHKHSVNEQGKPAAIVSEDVQPASTEQETVAKEKKVDPITPGTKKIITRDEIKEIIHVMIKNGGVKEDLSINSKLNAMLGKEIALNSKNTSTFHKFEEMKSFLEVTFDEVKKEYDDKRTTYPLQIFLKLIEGYAKSEKTEEEFLNDNLFLIAKNDNTFLGLQSNVANESDEPNIEFTSLDDLKKYIHGVYEIQKKIKDLKERDVSKKDNEKESTSEQEKVELERAKHDEDNATNKDTIKREEKKASFKEPTFTSFNEVKPLGIELIKEHAYTKEDIDKWLVRNILNKQLDEQKDKGSIITEEKIVRSIGNQFVEFFDGISASNNEEFIDKKITENVKNAKTIASVVTTVRTAIKEAEETGVKFTKTYSVSELFKRITESAKELNPDLHKKHMANKKDKKNPEKSTLEKKGVFIPEEVRITDPDLWNKHKDSTHLNQLVAAGTEICKEGIWQKALSLCLQVIPQSNIETAKNWDEKTIVNWFNKNIATKGKTENVKPEEKQEEKQPVKKKDLSKTNENNNQFKAIQSANSKIVFKKALGELLKENSNSPDFHKEILQAIKKDKITGKYARQLARNPESDILNLIKKTKNNIEKYT